MIDLSMADVANGGILLALVYQAEDLSMLFAIKDLIGLMLQLF